MKCSKYIFMFSFFRDFVMEVFSFDLACSMFIVGRRNREDELIKVIKKDNF